MASAPLAPLVIGTAGHVDHGKSTLVKSLTGVDPDRLPQEKQRGMTIELGFANMTLRSGRPLSFVDVPGHERFVATMVAGASGIDAALLIVAADEGVMPQTREHVAILDLLQVRTGIVVITKTDLVDSDLLHLVEQEIAEFLRGTTLGAAPIVVVSARTGAGFDDLKAALTAIEPLSADESTPPPRLVVDRVFSLTGFGTVVTGPASGPAFVAGNRVEIYPGPRKARIRGIQQRGESIDVAERGRTALNLSGIAGQPRRGDVVTTPGSMMDCRRFDALITVLSAAPQLEANHGIVVHAGADAIPARIFPLERTILSSGSTGWCQIRLDRPAALWRGQRIVLRLASPAETIAGGTIADIAPRRRASDPAASRMADFLSPAAETVMLGLLRDRPQSAARLARWAGILEPTVTELLSQMERRGAVFRLGTRYFAPEGFAAAQTKVISWLESKSGSGAAFLPLDELRHPLRLAAGDINELVRLMVEQGSVITDRDEAAGTATGSGAILIGLPGADSTEGSGSASRVLELLEAGGWQPPAIEEILSLAGAEDSALRRLESAGQVVRIEAWLYLHHRNFDSLVGSVCSLIERRGSITVAQLRDELGSSRKYALAYATYLDGQRVTRRAGDLRLPGKNFDQIRAQLAHSG